MDVHTIAFNQEDPIQIRFNDIDLLGHVNNTIIQEYFDFGGYNVPYPHTEEEGTCFNFPDTICKYVLRSNIDSVTVPEGD